MVGIKDKNLFFTLPGSNILELTPKLKLSLKIYFYLFYLFRFFIFKESIYIFESIIFFIFNNSFIKKKYIQFNKDKYKINFFKINWLMLYNKLNLKNLFIYNYIIIKDLRFIIFFILIFKGYNIYDNLFFFYRKSSIYLFQEFIIRIPFILFIAFSAYIYKFKIYKYNEYLKRTVIAFNNPIIKLILRVNWKVKKNEKYNSNRNILFTFQLYFDNFIFHLDKYKRNKKVVSKINIFLLNKTKNFKFFVLFNRNIFIFLYHYLKIYFINIFYIYIYNVWILQLHLIKGLDFIESYKWNIFYILHLYWMLYKYSFDLPIWLYILVILQIIKIYLKNTYIEFNKRAITLLYTNNLLIFNINYCILKVTSIIFIVYLERIYFKFFELAQRRYYNNLKYNWKRAWSSIIKYYPIDFIYIPLNYYDKSRYMNIYIYNLDLINWKFFYSFDFLFNSQNLNLINTIKQIQLNNYLEHIYINYCDNLWCNYKRKENSLMNFLFFYNFNRDLFYKIIFLNYSLLYKNSNNLILTLKVIHKNYLFKLILKELQEIHHLKILLDYKNLNSHIFNIIYDKYICIIIYIIFIKKYIK